MNRKKIIQIIGVIGLIASVVVFVHKPSFPTPDKIVFIALFAFMSFGQAISMLKHILPFAGLLLVYESFRGIVPKINDKVNFMFMVDADKVMFGGKLPTAVLQGWWWSGRVRLFDFVYYLSYMMHFVSPFVLALVIWKKKPRYYWQYVIAFVVVSFAGFLTYLAFPAAPPWMASDMGLIEPIERISSHVWFALGVHDFPSIYNKIAANPVAAMPSLHAAYATLVALFITKLWKARVRYIVWVYPMLIYIGTVYSGEHYVIDEIAGAAYAVGAFYAAPHIERWLRKLFPGKQQRRPRKRTATKRRR